VSSFAHDDWLRVRPCDDDIALGVLLQNILGWTANRCVRGRPATP